MKLKEARAVRDEVERYGLYCIVPRGHGPDKYFAEIYHAEQGAIRFYNRPEARKYLADMLREQRKKHREYMEYHWHCRRHARLSK